MDNENLMPDDSGTVADSVNLRHYWHIILERRWLVLTTFICVFALCLIYLYRAPKIYQSVTRLQIDRETEGVLYIKDSISIDSREQDYLQTQYKNLLSFTLINSVVEDMRLAQDPRYSRNRDVVRAVAEDISVVPLRLSRLVDIKVEHTKSELAANIASNLVHRFVDKNLEHKKLGAQNVVGWLQTEVEVQKTMVTAKEKDIAALKQKLNNVSVEDSQNIEYQALQAATKEFITAEGRAAMARKTLERVQTLLTNGVSPESIPHVRSEKVVQELTSTLAMKDGELAEKRKQYGEKYPDVIKLTEHISNLRTSLSNECDRIIQAIANEADLAKAQEDALAAQKDRIEQRLLALGEKKIQYDSLVRDADLLRTLLHNLEKNLQENQLAANSKINNMWVVDEASVPFKPIKPRLVLTLILGVIGGMVLGCALAFFVNYLDDSIKTQEDVEIYLRLPFLGYVSNIKSNSVIERDLQAHQHPQSTAAEGFRTIRAAIALMPNADKFRVITVTSTIPSEGKSLLTTNLAIVTSQTGLKTLLVDGDLRRPSVHKAFQLHSPVGLSSYLMNTVENLDGIIHTTEVPNLDVVCAGAVPSTPSELLGSKRMRQFLQEAGRRYDRVFVDCPPVSAVSDPLVVAAMTDGVVFVTKFNKIRREHARKSLQRIQDAGIRILGVVLNDIDFEGKDSYYYSYYYYQNRYYSSHYKSKTAKPAKPEDAAKPKDPGAKVTNT